MASRLGARIDRAAARVGGGDENLLRRLTDAELQALIAMVKARLVGEPEPDLPDDVEASRIKQVFADMGAYGKAGNKS